MTYGLKESLRNDLVSRKDVIRYIHEEMDEWINVDEPGDELAYEVEQIINEVPMIDIKNVLNPDSFEGEPQTNEEWFDTLSTEEKAEWIVETFLPTYGAYWVVHNEKLLNSATWVEWLKQPHGEE